jgi:hypothetical protein
MSRALRLKLQCSGFKLESHAGHASQHIMSLAINQERALMVGKLAWQGFCVSISPAMPRKFWALKPDLRQRMNG